jgi:hypothetical protein
MVNPDLESSLPVTAGRGKLLLNRVSIRFHPSGLSLVIGSAMGFHGGL